MNHAENMKILIVNPNFRGHDIIGYRPRQPLSLAYIYSVLKAEFGCDTDLFDLNIDDESGVPAGGVSRCMLRCRLGPADTTTAGKPRAVPASGASPSPPT